MRCLYTETQIIRLEVPMEFLVGLKQGDFFDDELLEFVSAET